MTPHGRTVETEGPPGRGRRQGAHLHQAGEGDHDRRAQRRGPEHERAAAAGGRRREEGVDAADTLERAIKKGAGLLDENVNYETVVYEGFAPHRVPVIVECLTDNKNRTATNVRVLFRKGQLGNLGLGVLGLLPRRHRRGHAAAGAVDAEAAAIEAGAQDVEPADEGALSLLHRRTAISTPSTAPWPRRAGPSPRRCWAGAPRTRSRWTRRARPRSRRSCRRWTTTTTCRRFIPVWPVSQGRAGCASRWPPDRPRWPG